MKIFFDVGANFGTHSLDVAKSDPDTIVYAFEPTPYLVNYLKKESENLDNYNVIPFAVSDYNGNAKFNIAGVEDWGCSSLLEFSENSKLWGGRDFRVTEVVDVQVIKLSDFIKENKIEKIDYFHCDTQGSDLNVLVGLENYIHIIQEGMIEAAGTEDILYVNQNGIQECLVFLQANNFLITEIEPDNYGFEYNIKFKKRD